MLQLDPRIFGRKTPLSRLFWLTIQRGFQHSLNLIVIVFARLTTAGRIG